MFIPQIAIAVTGDLTSHMLGVTVGFFGASFGWVLFGVSIAMQNVNAELQELPPERSQHSDHSVHRSKAFSNPAWGAGGALAPALFFGLWGQRPPENVLGPCDCTEMEQPLWKITCRLGGPVWRLRYEAVSCLCQWCACRCGCQHDLCSESTAWLVAERRWSNVGWDRGFSSTAGSCTPKFYHMLLFLCWLMVFRPWHNLSS